MDTFKTNVTEMNTFAFQNRFPGKWNFDLAGKVFLAMVV